MGLPDYFLIHFKSDEVEARPKRAASKYSVVFSFLFFG